MANPSSQMYRSQIQDPAHALPSPPAPQTPPLPSVPLPLPSTTQTSRLARAIPTQLHSQLLSGPRIPRGRQDSAHSLASPEAADTPWVWLRNTPAQSPASPSPPLCVFPNTREPVHPLTAARSATQIPACPIP